MHSEHYDPTVGFVIKHPKIKIGYTSDGCYYPGQENYYNGCDILILNVLVPKGKESITKKHMSIDDAIKLIKAIEKKPRLVVVQHFSFWMLQNNIFKQVKILKDTAKIPVIQAEDSMGIDMETLKSCPAKA